MSASFRVLLEMDVAPAQAAQFEAAWSEVAGVVATNPANRGQALMRDCDHPGRYHVLSDWTDEDAFRRFERSAEHAGNRARLAPYRAGVAMTTLHVLVQVPGRAA